MSLYLVQHGLCHSKQEDPAKGLTEQGTEVVRRIAGVTANYNVPVSAIAHSGKLRARQTADIMAEVLQPSQGVTVMDHMAPLDDVVPFAEYVDLDSNLMLVGHLPFLEKLTAYLITYQVTPIVFQMQNAGVVCIDLDSRTSRPVIKWTLMPKIE